MCPITGMSADAIARIVSAALRPPPASPLPPPPGAAARRCGSRRRRTSGTTGTACPPRGTRACAPAPPPPCAGPCPPSSRSGCLEWPSTTCPSESPTRITSTPDVVEDAGEQGVVRRDHHDLRPFRLHPPKVEDVGLAHRHRARPLAYAPKKYGLPEPDPEGRVIDTHRATSGRNTSRTAAAPFYDPVSVRATWIPAVCSAASRVSHS